MAGPDPAHPFVRAFVHSLRDLGLIEGRDIVIVRRSAEGRGLPSMATLMQEVIGLDVDVIVTTGPGVKAAKDATGRIAIVGLVDDPLDSGLIDSLARPGHNVTGLGESSPVIYGKQLQLLKEVAPTISRVAVIGWHHMARERRTSRAEADAAARALGLDLLWLGVDQREDFEAAFIAIVRARSDALIALGTHVNFGHRQLIADFALKQRLPSIGFPDAGMLMSYESDNTETFRRAAVYVKKILDGAKPGDLPFEQPMKYSLIINLKTAKALGLMIPQSLLLRADEVIQ